MRLPVSAAHAISAALHAAAFLALSRLPALPEKANETVSVDLVEVVRPPPPVEPPPATRALLSPPRAAPRAPSPAPAAPPPPNAPPPPDAPPATKTPVKIGVSLSSTTTSGGIAAPVGNTLYGDMPRTAPEPEEVRPYRSDEYVPPTQVTVLPRPIGECRPRDEYPEAARRLGVEGTVVLSLTVDATGAVAEARVLEDPGHGLGPAAVAIVRRHCRFSPGRRGETAVTTGLRYRVTFELP